MIDVINIHYKLYLKKSHYLQYYKKHYINKYFRKYISWNQN